MARAIAVLNAGSSSLKFTIYRDDDGSLRPLRDGQLDGLFERPRFEARDDAGTVVGAQTWSEGTRLGHEGAIKHLLDWLDGGALPDLPLAAVGHRVVHGGVKYFEPVRITAEILSELDALIPLAPLHQPHNLAPIRVIQQEFPRVPQVACFDTAFHRTQPELARRIALPDSVTQDGVQRYGFHGLSYEYISSVLSNHTPELTRSRVVVAHLGNGCSLCALRDGRSVATTMGFSTLDGPPMGTRCGSLDPGVLLYLLDHRGLDARGLERLLYKESGLLGVSGVSGDMRTLLASADPRAALAIDLFVYRISREIGSLAAALEGLDALVFTAGIGEHAAVIRERIARSAAWLGLELDETANEAGGPRISQEDSRVSAWVIPTDEELVIARHTRRLLTADAGGV